MAEYIEREAAYEDFEKCNSENPKWTPSRVKTLISRQKSADVSQVRHGRWENITGGMITLGDCSECKVRQPVIGTNYCKNCGAKMDGDTYG